MTAALTTSQMANLNNILTDTNLGVAARATLYYQTLAGYGFNYGSLGFGVVTDSTVAGQIANNYLTSAAQASNVTLTPTITANIELSLAQADLAARENAGGADLTGAAIEQYHQIVFNSYGLPITAWTGYVPYTVLGESGWQQMVQGSLGTEMEVGIETVFHANSSQLSSALGWFYAAAKATVATPGLLASDAAQAAAIINDGPGPNVYIDTNKDTVTFTPTQAGNGSTVTYFMGSNSGPVCTIQDPTGTGSVSADGLLLNYTAQDITNLTFNAAGNAVATVTPNSGQGTPLSFTFTSQGIVANNIDGIPMASVAIQANGSYTNTVTAPDGSVSSTTYNTLGQPTSGLQTVSGGTVTTIYNYSSNSPWLFEQISKNLAGNTIGTATFNNDGTITYTQIDPTTNEPTYSCTTDAQTGEVLSQTISPSLGFEQFGLAALDTLTTQLISKVLIKNNLPASIAVSAFSTATIQSAVNGSISNFPQDFAMSIANVAGGLAGSEVGSLLAKALGIPTEIGSLIGGVGGNVLTQVAVNSSVTQALVNEVGAELGLTSSVDVASDAGAQGASAGAQVAGQTLDIGQAFAGGLAAAGGGLLGSYLGSLIAGNSIQSGIGGAVGGAAGGIGGGLIGGAELGTELGSFAGPVGAFIGAVVGALVGTLLGGLFNPPRGQPFVVTVVGVSGGKFADLYVGQDNNGNINDAYAISNSLVGFVNQVITSIGGTLVSAPNWEVGYGDDNGIFSLPQGPWPPSPSQKFGSVNDAIENAAYNLLRDAQITGGNPMMMWELKTSTATNMNDLLTDLGVAQDYQLYTSNALLLGISIVASGNSAEYTNLQNQLTAAQNLGLTRLSYDGTTLTINTTAALIAGDLNTLTQMPGTTYKFAFSDTSANMLSVLSTLETQAVAGHLTSIQFTDTTTPTLSFSAVQVSSNFNALSAIRGSYLLSVTDTAMDVAVNLNILQTFVTAGHLNSLVLTDSGTPIIPLQAVQLTADAGALGLIAHAYKVVVIDTTANISANFAAIAAAQAAGHISSITATDSSDPVLGISYAQYTQDTATLALMTTPYLFGLVDTSANAEANLAALQTLVTSGKLVSVKFTDATPTLSVTVAQTTSYASLLALMAGEATINVTGIAANTSYTITGNGLTIPLAVGATIQSSGTNSFLDTLNGSNLTVTLANSKVVVSSAGVATFTTPLTGFGSSVLSLAVNGTATFTVGSDNLTFQANSMKSVSYASGAFSFGVTTPSTAYTEVVTWNPTTGQANLVLTATGGQPVTTSLGQVNPGTIFSVTGTTITNTNSSSQLLYSTTVNSDGSQADTVYNYSGGTNKDTVTMLNASGQQTATRWDHTDGSYYISYVNPTTQAAIANLTVNANGSGSISTANNQTITFAAGNVPSVSIGSAGDTLLTLKTSSGSGITETFDMSSGQIVSTVNGNAMTYTLANAGASVDTSGNVTITGGGSTIVMPENGGNATFTVGQDILSFPQTDLQSISSAGGIYTFGLSSPVTGFAESLTWNPVTGLMSLVMTPTGGQAMTTPLGLFNPGNILSISGTTISIEASNGTVIASTTVNFDGTLVNTFNNGAGALHVAANGIATFIDGNDQLTFQPNVLQSWSSANGIFSFVINPLSTAYTETITWNPTNGMASLVLTATGKSAVTTTLGQVNPGTVFSVSGSTITNTNSAGQALYSTTVNSDGSQIDTVYNYSGNTTATITSLNNVGQQTSVRWNNTNGSVYTSYYNPSTQAVIANFSVNADTSGYVATNNNQTINFAAGNSPSVSIGSAGDTLLTLKTSAGITETLDMSSGKIVSTINGNVLTYTLANAGGSVDASGNVTLTGGGSTIVLPANGSAATFTVGQDNLTFPQNVLQSLSSSNNIYNFGVVSTATGFSEVISWNPSNGVASVVLTPTAGGAATTTAIGQINPGNVFTISGPYITIASSSGTPIAATTVNSDGSQVNIYYNNTSTVNETVTSYNAAGQETSVRWDNANGTTYTSYYKPGTTTVMANRSVNADGSGYVATAYNQTVNFTSSSLFAVSLDASGNPLITITPLDGVGAVETLDCASGQLTSTINGNSLIYTLANPAISYDSSGDLTLTASGSTLVLPSNGSNYTFTVGQDTISLAPGSVASVAPNGTSYNFNLKPPTGTSSEYVTWSPQTGIATLNVTPTGGSLASTNMGYINPGYVLNVSSSLITNTNASGLVINSYAVQSNGSVVSTASATTYTDSATNGLFGASGNDTVTVSGTGNTIYDSSGDTITLTGASNTVIAQGSGNTINNTNNGTNVYEFSTGFGTQTINNAGSASGNAKGTLDFLSSITDENLWFKQSGNNLVIEQLGTSNQITLNGWFGTNAGAQVTTIEAGGLNLTSQVAQLVSAMATYAANNSSFNPTTATAMPTDTTLQAAITTAWHH